jgi:hypothetical protein
MISPCTPAKEAEMTYSGTKAFGAAALAAAVALLMTLVSLDRARAEDAQAWPRDARVYFISPADGATVKSPVHVVFGLMGLGVAPAGTEKPHTGHHHLLIDTELPTGEALDEPIPADAHHIHFGGGQTETTVELAPGTHTLQLVVGDANHVPHNPPLASKKITITVEK